jgi:hypothetical protein
MFLTSTDVEVRYTLSMFLEVYSPLTKLRPGGKGEVYAYMPPNEENTAALLSVPPKSYGNPEYGFSVGRGSFIFSPGVWTTVAQRVKLNDPGEPNGEICSLRHLQR